MVRGATISDILGRANAVSALFALHASHPRPLGVVQLAAEMGGNKGMGKPMAFHFADHGLATVREVPSTFPGGTAYEVMLTEKGIQLAKLLERALEIVPDDEIGGPVSKGEEFRARRRARGR